MSAPKKVAIIHKARALVNLFADMTKDLGYAPAEMLVSENTRAAEVASFVRDVQPDLVLLAESYQSGIFGPSTTQGRHKGEGLEALVEIRRTYPALPVFMVSGNSQYEEMAIQKGANGYLPMPITIVQFKEFIESNTQS